MFDFRFSVPYADKMKQYYKMFLLLLFFKKSRQSISIYFYTCMVRDYFNLYTQEQLKKMPNFMKQCCFHLFEYFLKVIRYMPDLSFKIFLRLRQQYFYR